MPITISSTGEEQTFEPIPKGNYEAFVNSIKPKETKDHDKMLNIRFVIADGQFQGRSLFSNFVLTPESKWKIIQLLISVGLMAPKTKSDFTLSDEATELIGKRCGIKVTHNSDADSPYFGREEINGFFRPASVMQGAAPAPAPAPVMATGTIPPPPPAPATRRL
jgi:hypothetical protein